MVVGRWRHGGRNGIRWWLWRSSFYLCRRVSLLSVTLLFLVGQALGMVGRGEVGGYLVASGLVLLGGYCLTERIRTAGEGGIGRVRTKRKTKTAVALFACLVMGVISVSKEAPRMRGGDTGVRVRGIVETIRRPLAGAVQFRVMGYRQEGPHGGDLRLRDEGVPVTLLCQAADLPWRAASQIRVGDAIELVGTVQSVGEGDTVSSYERSLSRAGFDGRCTISWLTFFRSQERKSALSHDIGANKDRLIGDRIASLITQAAGDTESAALLLSMTLGTRDRLSRDTEELFRFFGLSHLLVLSGYQLSQLIRLVGVLTKIVVAPLWRWVDRVPFYLISAVVSGSVGLVLASMVGFEVSITRALIGSMLIEVIRQREGVREMGHSLLVTALVMSAVWPGMLFEPAGALTMSALLGITLGSAIAGEGFRGVVGAHGGALLCTFAVSCIWFRPPNILAAIAVAPFASIVAMISFYGTLAGLGLLISGVDGEGVCLRLIAEAAEWVRRGLWWMRGI